MNGFFNPGVIDLGSGASWSLIEQGLLDLRIKVVK
jgi:hypothetical protein